MTMRWMSWITLLLGGCAAKGTYHIAQAEQAVSLAEADEADELAVYAWTMADAYLKKSREEYAHADYEAAERFAGEAERWADRARDVVRSSTDPMQTAPDALPELRDVPPAAANPLYNNDEDDVEFDMGDQ
ncbi:MAG: putative lipoprotein YmbA [Myxococcota bacterium]|jgi:uncharacterized lipoprotein YmbA